MVAQAKATAMTSEQVAALELQGEGEHALLKTPMDAMDTLRLHYYAARQVDAFLEASEAGDEDAAARASDIARDLSEITLPRWRAALHQAGLGLRVLANPASAESATLRAAYNAIAGAGGDLDQTVKALAELPTVEQREEMLRQAAAGGRALLQRNLLNYYVESKLSFNTVAKKLSTDALTLLFSIPERAIAEAYGAGTRAAGLAAPEATTPPGETAAMLRGAMDGFSDALRLAHESMREDRPLFEGAVGYGEPSSQGGPGLSSAGTRFENTAIGSAIDYFGQLIHLPSRGILGVDQFAKAMNFQMQLRARGELDQLPLGRADLRGQAVAIGAEFLQQSGRPSRS